MFRREEDKQHRSRQSTSQQAEVRSPSVEIQGLEGRIYRKSILFTFPASHCFRKHPNAPRRSRKQVSNGSSTVKEVGLRGVREEFIDEIKTFDPELSTKAFQSGKPLQLFRLRVFRRTTKSRTATTTCISWTKPRVVVKINPENGKPLLVGVSSPFPDDYIHASTVEIAPDLTYICAQGPLLNTVAQFWLMCIQEETRVVLQLCRNFEDRKEKCCEYMRRTPTGLNLDPCEQE